MIARWIIRQASADVAARDDAVAAAERRAERGGEAHGGLGSQVDVDEAGRAVAAERRARGPRLPDDALVDLRAGLDLLERVDADAREDARLRPDRHLVADRDALVHAHVVADVAARGRGSRPRRRRCGRCTCRRRSTLRATRAPSRTITPWESTEYGADRGAVRDAAVRADERRAVDGLELVDVDLLADPDVPAEPEPGHLELDAAVERVEVRLPELLEVADVLPVAVEHVPVDRPSHLEQEREELLREVVRAVVGHVPEHLRLEHVDPGVDRVGEDLSPRRLLEEPLDAAVVVGHDDPELERVVDRLEADRDRGALRPVRLDERGQVDVAERVARDDEEGLVEPLLREPDRAGRAERLLLDGVVDVERRAPRRRRSRCGSPAA